MPDTAKAAYQRALRLVGAEWKKHRATSFQSLREIPSGNVRCLADHLRSLAPTDQDVLVDAFIAHGAARLSGVAAVDLIPSSQRQVLELWFENQRLLMGGFDYLDLRISKRIVRQARDKGLWPRMPESLPALVDGLTPSKAHLIRRHLAPALLQRFGLEQRNQGAGEWAYVDPSERLRWALLVDFGGMGSQLRWDVWWTQDTPHATCYEALLGAFSDSNWDWLAESTLASDVDLLLELVAKTVVMLDDAGRLDGAASPGV